MGQRTATRDCPSPSCEGRDGPTASYKGNNYPIKERITLGNGRASVRRARGMCRKSKQLGPRGGGRDRKDNEGQRCSFPGALILTRHHGAPEKSESWFSAEDWLISLGRALTACSRNMAGGRDIIGSRVNLDERSYDPGSGLFD